MNNPVRYRRPQVPQPTAVPVATDEPQIGALQQAPAEGRRVVWVRPTDLPALGGQAVADSLEVHAELTRTIRAVPARALRPARAVGLGTFGAASPESGSRVDGPGL